MKNFIKAVGFVALSFSVFCLSYSLADKYFSRFRRSYITIENEHVNV